MHRIPVLFWRIPGYIRTWILMNKKKLDYGHSMPFAVAVGGASFAKSGTLAISNGGWRQYIAGQSVSQSITLPYRYKVKHIVYVC